MRDASKVSLNDRFLPLFLNLLEEMVSICSLVMKSIAPAVDDADFRIETQGIMTIMTH